VAASPFRTFRFRLTFIICWWIWAQLHFHILSGFGFSWRVALLDSLVSNGLLLCSTLLLTLMLRFYIPQRSKYAYILALCSVLSVLGLLLSRSLMILLVPDAADYTAFFSKSFAVRLAIGFLITGCMALVSVLWYTVQESQEVEKRKMEADKLSREAELFNLRQQLQPHFLFNSLNSINALIGSQPGQARTMIQQLSDFLRGTLKKEDSQWSSLQEELQHLELYLGIEKVRFGHRLATSVSNRTTGDHQLPSMVLQPVVENAIKFGLYDTIDAIEITIEARMEDSNLVLEVTNPFDPQTSQPRTGTGFGLRSVQRRLYLLFSRSDLLRTATAGTHFITTIVIPQHHDQNHHHR
jgi:two-component system LytT family sensor kinase